MKRYLQFAFALGAVLIASQTAGAQEWSQPWARERIAKSSRHSRSMALSM